jgi:hypothetical protein
VAGEEEPVSVGETVVTQTCLSTATEQCKVVPPSDGGGHSSDNACVDSHGDDGSAERNSAMGAHDGATTEHKVVTAPPDELDIVIGNTEHHVTAPRDDEHPYDIACGDNQGGDDTVSCATEHHGTSTPPQKLDTLPCDAPHQFATTLLTDHGIPVPPYDERTCYGLNIRIKCFFENCTYQCNTYESMQSHVKRHHKVSQSCFKGTYYHGQLCKEQNAAKAARKQQRPKQVRGMTLPKSDAVTATTHDSTPARRTKKRGRKNKCKHVARECYVKIDAKGDICMPLKVFGMAGPAHPTPPHWVDSHHEVGCVATAVPMHAGKRSSSEELEDLFSDGPPSGDDNCVSEASIETVNQFELTYAIDTRSCAQPTVHLPSSSELVKPSSAPLMVSQPHKSPYVADDGCIAQHRYTAQSMNHKRHCYSDSSDNDDDVLRHRATDARPKPSTGPSASRPHLVASDDEEFSYTQFVPVHREHVRNRPRVRATPTTPLPRAKPTQHTHNVQRATPSSHQPSPAVIPSEPQPIRLEIAESVTSWTSTMYVANKRNAWPIPITEKRDFSGVGRYIKARHKTDETVKCRIQGLEMLYSCFDVDPCVCHIEFAAALHNQGMLDKLMETQLLSIDYCWTRKIAEGLTWFFDFLEMECTKKQIGAWAPYYVQAERSPRYRQKQNKNQYARSSSTLRR